MAAETHDAVKPPEERRAVEIGGPITLWLVVLAIGVVLSLFVSYAGISHGTVGPAMTKISTLILQLPGVAILPILVALWIGARIGSAKRKSGEAAKSALVNAAYVSVIYVVAIVVIYLITEYLQSTPFTSPNALITVDIVLPLVILFILTPAIAALAAKRKSMS